ncbi:MAG: zinc ribbon domain-containing protein, partial [Chloroflexota bacterium]|nr:zinc ribbon domain-containing protein [Chloroflexota bacterium]
MTEEKAKPGIDEEYCPSCGAVVKKQAVICVHCGVSRRPASTTSAVQPPVTRNWESKSKTASVLLAVFLASWTWVYTYKRDGWKFWTAVGIGAVNLILVLATLGIWLFVGWIVGFGIWLWALIDTIAKPS